LALEAAIAADDDGDEVRRPVGARLLDELGRRILSGQYPPGAPLPTELQLCAEFGVSRTAMREATKMLAAKGLVVARKRAGTLVQDADNWNRLDPDVLAFFRKTGRGYQTTINAVLRKYVESRKGRGG